MEVYDPIDPHMDLLVAQMYQRIVDTGEMNTIFASPHTLGSFLRAFQPPNSLIFEADDEGIFYAAWFEPTFSGAFMSVWMRPDRRQSRASYTAFVRSVTAGFNVFSVLLGVTKQEALLAVHEHVGYDLLCRIPGLFGGQDAYVLQLNKDKFYGKLRARKPRKVRRKLVGKLQRQLPIESGRGRQGRRRGRKPGVPASVQPGRGA